MREFVTIFVVLSLVGCSYNQGKYLGMHKSQVNSYAQNMSNVELCDTLYYHRKTPQTQASIGAEFNRRRLSKSWCDEEMNELYLSGFVNWLAHAVDDHDNEEAQEATTLPAEI